MSTFESLFFNDVALDAPHIKHLAGILAQKAPDTFAYIQRIENAVSELCAAQSAVSVTYQKLSDILHSAICEISPETEVGFKQVGFQFLEFMNELVDLHSILSSNMRSQLLRILEDYGNFPRKLASELETLERCEKLRDQAFHSYMKLSKKADAKEVQLHLLELASLRRDFDCTATSYYGNLNRVEHLGRIAPVISMTNILKEHVNHAKRLSELFGDTAAGFSGIVVSALQQQLSAESSSFTKFSDRAETLHSEPLTKFYTEPWMLSSGSSGDFITEPPNPKLHFKSGRLLFRQRVNLVWRWNDVFCSTQNGNLMYQHYDDIGASLLMDLNQKGVYAEATDCDDRRNVFQLVSPTEKRIVLLQAESQKERDEWICTLTNIIFDVNNLQWNHPTSGTEKISSSASASSPETTVHWRWSMASLPAVNFELPKLPQLNVARDAELLQTYQIVESQCADQNSYVPSGSHSEHTESVTVESTTIADPLELGFLGFLELPPITACSDAHTALQLNDVFSYVLSCRTSSFPSAEPLPCRILFTKRDVWLLASDTDADSSDRKRADVLLRIPLIRFRCWSVFSDNPSLACLTLQAPIEDVPSLSLTQGLVCFAFQSECSHVVTESLLASHLEMMDSLQDDDHELGKILLANITRLSDPPSSIEDLSYLTSVE